MDGSSNRARTEGAELYRTLGVTPDAEYTEVMEAVERLKKKYSGDRKQARHSSNSIDCFGALDPFVPC